MENVYAVYGADGQRIGTVIAADVVAAEIEAGARFPGAVSVDYLYEALDGRKESQ